MTPSTLAPLDLADPEFTLAPADFERIRTLIHQRAGISLHAGKQAMVYSRLARRLRETAGGDRLKLIAMSASVLSFNRDDAFAAGCDDFLSKPFREDELLRQLALHLDLTLRHAEEPPPATGAALPDPADLEALLAAARRGEITTLRRHLAELRTRRPDCADLLNELETLTASFRMELIRRRLETVLTASP